MWLKSPVCTRFLCTVNHARCNIAAMWRGCMLIKALDNQIYIFVPTFFVLKFRTNSFAQREKSLGSGRKKSVGSPHRNQTYFISLYLCPNIMEQLILPMARKNERLRVLESPDCVRRNDVRHSASIWILCSNDNFPTPGYTQGPANFRSFSLSSPFDQTTP